MKERLRAPLAAVVALLIGGDLAARGPAAFLDIGRFLFPYLWLFLAFEAARRRRRLGDAEAFLFGAAVGLAHDGIFAKTLQDGLFFLGINWLGAASSAFDWGLITVVSLHAVDALWPRPEEENADAGTGLVELAALVFLPAAALLGYLLDAYSGRARVDRMLGPAWLLADLLFAAAAWALIRRAFARAEEDEPRERDRGLWALAALCAWLPGAQIFARLGGDWPSAISVLYVGGWTAGLGLWARMLWRERGHADTTVKRASRPALAIAAWRLAGAVLLCLVVGSMETDGRTAALFSFLVDLPVRLLFLSVFFASRLAV